jgi:hypothetical protein
MWTPDIQETKCTTAVMLKNHTPPYRHDPIEERGRGHAFPITNIWSPHPNIAAASPCFTSRPTDFSSLDFQMPPNKRMM